MLIITHLYLDPLYQFPDFSNIQLSSYQKVGTMSLHVQKEQQGCEHLQVRYFFLVQKHLPPLYARQTVHSNPWLVTSHLSGLFELLYANNAISLKSLIFIQRRYVPVSYSFLPLGNNSSSMAFTRTSLPQIHNFSSIYLWLSLLPCSRQIVLKKLFRSNKSTF